MNTKGIKFLAVLAVLAMAFAAFAILAPAEENDADETSVTTEAEFYAAVAESNFSIKLANDITLAVTSAIVQSGTIDLGGHKLQGTGDNALWIKQGSVIVTGNGELARTDSPAKPSEATVYIGSSSQDSVASITIDKDVTVTNAGGGYGVVAAGKDLSAAFDQIVVINGKVTTSGPAVSGNGTGTFGATSITIGSDAVITSTESVGIYQPQAGTLVVKGSVTGVGGIEIKSGSLIVSDGAKIKATGSISHTVNSNGPSTSGYGIAVVENSAYKGSPSVVFNDGTVKGGIILTPDNAVTASKAGSIIIDGGAVNGSVDKVEFETAAPVGTIVVNGGSFSDLTALPYVQSGKAIDFTGDFTGEKKLVYTSPVTINSGTTLKIISGAAIEVGPSNTTGEPAVTTYALTNNGVIDVLKGGALTGSANIGGEGKIEFDDKKVDPKPIENTTPAAVTEEIIADLNTTDTQAIIEFPAEVTSVSDTKVIDTGAKEVAFVGTNQAIAGLKIAVATDSTSAGSISFSGFSAVSATITTGTGTSAQTVTVKDLKGSFTISKGSIIIDGTDYSGEITVDAGAELKLSGTIVGDLTVKYADPKGTEAPAKVIIETGKGLNIADGKKLVIGSDMITLQVDGSIAAVGELKTGAIKTMGNVVVNEGGVIDVKEIIDKNMADTPVAAQISITANAGSKIAATITFSHAKSSLVAYSGSDINGVKSETLSQISGKDAEGGKWSYTVSTTDKTLTLNNYNGSYNFEAYADNITAIDLVGNNTVAYTASSTYAGATLFGTDVKTISTVQGSATLTINADLSAATGDSLANKLYVIHNDNAEIVEINAVAVAINVTGYNSDWTETQIAAGQFEGICAKGGLKLYNADLDVNVMALYAAKGGIGVDIDAVANLDITSCEEIIILSSGTAVVVKGDLVVKDTIVTANGQLQGMTVDGNITISNYAMVTVVNGLVAGDAAADKVSISQESVLGVDDLNLHGELTNNGNVVLTGDSIVQDGAKIINKAQFSNSGLIGVYGTLTNSTGGQFDNTGTVAVYQYKLPAAGILTLYDEGATTPGTLAKLKSVSVDPDNMVLNANGTITINNASLTFQSESGTPLGPVAGFKGTLTYNQVDKKSYSLYLTNDGAAISITYDETEVDKKIGKAYSLTLSGDVTIGATTYTLETNTDKTHDVVEDTIKVAVDTTGAFSVAGGTFDNEDGIVSLYKTATPIGSKGTFKGSYISTVATTMAGKMTGNIYSKGDVTVNGTLNGDIYSTGDVTIESTSDTSTAKVFGNVVMSNSKELKSFTLKGAMDGCLKYITEYNTVTSGTPVMQEFTATLDILGIEKYGAEDGMIIKATPGKDATSTTAATGGYFDLNRAAALAENASVKMALTEGKLAVSKSVALPVAYALVIEDDTTIEVAKTATFTIDGGLMVADGAEKNYELVTIPVKYGKLSYVMMFDVAEGYTVFSNVEFALSNCDENSVLTVGQNATMTDSVSIKAGVEVIVNNVSINFGKYGLEMAEGAKITLVGTGNLVFGVTGDDGETEPTLYYISGTVVYDDNALIIKGVRFVNDEIASSTIVGTAATSTADSKFTVAFDYNCGAIALAEGNLAGNIDLNVFVDDEEEEATYASYFIAEEAVSEAFITDAFAAYGEDDKEEVRTLVDVDGTMKVSKALTILGAYAGPGEIILADGIAVDVKDSAVIGLITIGNGTDGINATSVDSAFTIKSVAATTSVPAYVLLSNAVLKKAALETEGNVVADGVLLDAEFDKEKESENYVASLIVSEDSTLTVAKHDEYTILAGGLLLVKGTLNYYTEDTKSYGKIYYQVNFESEGYTVYTVLKTATMVAPAGTTISIEDDLTYDNTSLVIPTGISIEIAEGHAITLENGAYIILGDADEMNALGAAGCLTGVIIVDDTSFVIDYPNSGSMIIVYADEDKETLASEGIFLVQDVVYASVYGAKAFKLEPVLDILVPVVPGYYFNAWYLQNGEKVEDDTKITAGPFVANVVASKVTVVFSAVAGINYYVDGELVNVLEAPVKYDYGATVTAKISDTSKYQGTPLVNGKAYILIDDTVSKVTGSGVAPIPEPPQPEPEPVEENTGLTLTDILLIVLVVLIAIMVVILVLRLNRS